MMTAAFILAGILAVATFVDGGDLWDFLIAGAGMALFIGLPVGAVLLAGVMWT
mgnify:CR=1 FL=1